MNKKDLINPLYGLVEDDWSRGFDNYGLNISLSVLGWCDKNEYHKLYLIECSVCSKDQELFGDGFWTLQRKEILRGCIPCGCSKTPRWTKEQIFIRTARKCRELSVEFLGFIGKYKGTKTKVSVICNEHSLRISCTVNDILSGSYCRLCRGVKISRIKRQDDGSAVQDFNSTGSFAEGTLFKRSGRKNKYGHEIYWSVYCPQCDITLDAKGSNLKLGHVPCNCGIKNQTFAYINFVIDDDNRFIALKFGVSSKPNRRFYEQHKKTKFTVLQGFIFEFENKSFCRKAEIECKQTLACSFLSKLDFPDGYTETTSVDNLDKILEIFIKNGGEMIKNNDILTAGTPDVLDGITHKLMAENKQEQSK